MKVKFTIEAVVKGQVLDRVRLSHKLEFSEEASERLESAIQLHIDHLAKKFPKAAFAITFQSKMNNPDLWTPDPISATLKTNN